MISFNRRTKVFVCKEPTDMRASYDTLFAKAKGVLGQDPFSGHLFLFINARRTSMKCTSSNRPTLTDCCRQLSTSSGWAKSSKSFSR